MQGIDTIEQWGNLSAMAAIIVVFVWLIVKGWPSIQKQFADELKGQRAEFREELAAGREQSRILASSGSQAVSDLAQSFEGLKHAIEANTRQRDNHGD